MCVEAPHAAPLPPVLISRGPLLPLLGLGLPQNHSRTKKSQNKRGSPCPGRAGFSVESIAHSRTFVPTGACRLLRRPRPKGYEGVSHLGAGSLSVVGSRLRGAGRGRSPEPRPEQTRWSLPGTPVLAGDSGPCRGHWSLPGMPVLVGTLVLAGDSGPCGDALPVLTSPSQRRACFSSLRVDSSRRGHAPSVTVLLKQFSGVSRILALNPRPARWAAPGDASVRGAQAPGGLRRLLSWPRFVRGSGRRRAVASSPGCPVSAFGLRGAEHAARAVPRGRPGGEKDSGSGSSRCCSGVTLVPADLVVPATASPDT